MNTLFQWLRRFYAFGVSMATPFLASLFEGLKIVALLHKKGTDLRQCLFTY